MSRPIRVSLMATLLISATACTQPPAQIDFKGHESFGRSYIDGGYSSNSKYTRPAYTARPSYEPVQHASNSYVSQSTETTAAVQSIGVSDLSPPSKPAAKEIKTAESSAPVNQWTKRPHFSDAQAVKEPTQAEPVILYKKSSVVEDSKPKPLAATSTTAAPRTQSAFIWPVNGRKVISGYGPKGAGKANDGINIAAASGEPVWAAADGEVIYVGNELQSYGNMVLIKHPGSRTTTYAHLSRATVDKYDRVKQGDIIGYVGSTGNVKDAQLHFAVRDGKEPVDPAKYLSRSVAGL